MHNTLLLLTNRDQQIGLPLRGRPILLKHSYDYRLNCTLLAPAVLTHVYGTRNLFLMQEVKNNKVAISCCVIILILSLCKSYQQPELRIHKQTLSR